MPRIQYGQNRETRQSLTPLIYRYILNVDNDGISPYPADFQEIDAIWDIYRFGRIKFVHQNYLDSYLNSVIDPIVQKPIHLIEDKGFRFYPNQNYNGVSLPNSQALLSYVRTPPTIVWGFTLDANGREVYNQATSVDPVWYDSDMMMIIARALKMVGINLQASQVVQYADDILKNGQ